jgi:hypothetical protein
VPSRETEAEIAWAVSAGILPPASISASLRRRVGAIAARYIPITAPNEWPTTLTVGRSSASQSARVSAAWNAIL